MSLDDDIDAMTELHLRVALSHRKNVLQFVGACHNCSEPLEQGNFCSSECREDWEHRDKMKKVSAH